MNDNIIILKDNIHFLFCLGPENNRHSRACIHLIEESDNFRSGRCSVCNRVFKSAVPKLRIEHLCYCYNEECNQKEWERLGKKGKRKYTVVSGFTNQGKASDCPYCEKPMTIICEFEDVEYW